MQSRAMLGSDAGCSQVQRNSRFRWGSHLRTVGVILDQQGICLCLLPLQSQMHEAPTEWGQGRSEAYRGEELQQVGPEHLGKQRTLVCSCSFQGS